MLKTYAGDSAAVEVERKAAAAIEPARDRNPEALADLFAPDIILPEQFVEGVRTDSYVSGEKALMLAVLEDGIRCFQEHLRNPRSNPRLLSASTLPRCAPRCSPGRCGASPRTDRRACQRRTPRRSTGSTSAPSVPAACARPSARRSDPAPRAAHFGWPMVSGGGAGSSASMRWSSSSSSRTRASVAASPSCPAGASSASRPLSRSRRFAPSMVYRSA